MEKVGADPVPVLPSLPGEGLDSKQEGVMGTAQKNPSIALFITHIQSREKKHRKIFRLENP